MYAYLEYLVCKFSNWLVTYRYLHSPLVYTFFSLVVDKMKKKLNEVAAKVEPEVSKPTVEVVEKNIDPLNTLDPFWASKK